MKIAIIGTGIAGLSAAWLLNDKHDITVFEAESRIGGHSNTVTLDDGTAIDTGFIVYNTATYPNLIALFDHLAVQTMQTDMSFGVSLNNRRYEYSGERLFAQKRNILNPSHYLMIRDIIRFFKTAHDALDLDDKLTLDEYLGQKNYSTIFKQRHIYPMAAAIWSTSSGRVGDFPAKTFVRFFINHGLLKFKQRPPWRTVSGGSKEYVAKLSAPFKNKIRLNTPAKQIFRGDDKKPHIQINGEIFDHVILACHPDQSLSILKDCSDQEKEVLQCFPYSKNIAYLHKDPEMMPRSKAAWTSWNYLGSTNKKQEHEDVFVTYWMNRLQPFLPKNQDFFVSLNAPERPKNVLKEIIYAHPQYSSEALSGWDKIKTIQGVKNTWFCGAWCGYGFHEDGLSSGLAVAEALGNVKRPWVQNDVSPAGRHASPLVANLIAQKSQNAA